MGVLDPLPVESGSSSGQRLAETADLVEAAERLGYRRYWLAASPLKQRVLGQSTPVALTILAGTSERIRIGAVGLHAGDLALAALAKRLVLLGQLYPGRLDLGLLDPAIGIPSPTETLVGAGRVRDEERSDPPPRQAASPAVGGVGHSDGPRVPPGLTAWSVGEQWLDFAARQGMPALVPYRGDAAALGALVGGYRLLFVPSEDLTRPLASLSVSVSLCSERSVAPAASSRIVSKPGPLGHEDSLAEVTGPPAWVADRLVELAGSCAADELMIACREPNHSRRLETLEQLAVAMSAAPP